MQMIAVFYVFLVYLMKIGSMKIGSKQFNLRNLLTKKLDHDFMTEEEYDRHVITGCRNPKHLALTFDDGISQYTNDLLDILDQHHVKATFFIIGQSFQTSNRYKRTLIRMIREGHVVASHSFDHPDLTQLSREQIKDQMERTDDIFKSIVGIRPRFVRPPYGYVNMKVVNFLKSLGYIVINWSHDTNDWRFQDSYSTIVEYVKNQISSTNSRNQGPIVLQHDSLQSSIKLQSKIIKILRKKGYEFVSMYECIGREPYRI